jgi:hypothetical protein
MFFRLSSLELGLLLFGVVLGMTLQPVGVVQAALLGLVALILALGLRGRRSQASASTAACTVG